VHPPGPPPDSSFELLVLGLGIPPAEVGLLEQFERVRAHLRREVDRRRREVAKEDQVELACASCGEVTERSPTYAEKVLAGRAPPPLCLDCKAPARAAREDVEAAKFVEDLGERVSELAGAVAALR